MIIVEIEWIDRYFDFYGFLHENEVFQVSLLYRVSFVSRLRYRYIIIITIIIVCKGDRERYRYRFDLLYDCGLQ